MLGSANRQSGLRCGESKVTCCEVYRAAADSEGLSHGGDHGGRSFSSVISGKRYSTFLYGRAYESVVTGPDLAQFTRVKITLVYL